MIVSTAIVAHHTRKAWATDLAIATDASLALDPGLWGPGHNHRRAWQLANTTAADWILVIEDDAILCTNFTARLHAALETAPTPVVSLYLGTNYPTRYATTTTQAITQADQTGAHWITQPTLNHAVAVAIQQHHVTPMLNHTEHTNKPIDEAITQWMRTNNIRCSYTHPSLVDHRDNDTVIDGRTPRLLPRKAHRFAG
ncbi:hypothetical protein [Gordonia paraffinivorans]|uniref:hypothetical protein n=1 Tax=Gordonia paraffinivorans TaxID=175628 RepID=UPI003FCC7094